MSAQRSTVNAVIEAFNAMDVDAIMSYRASQCQRILLPSSMGYAPQDNTAYARSLYQLKMIFKNFSLKVDDIVEDINARTVCLWATARADTAAGPYENEYVWMWDFDETGTRIIRSKEYSDSVQNRDFYPKLQAAIKKTARDT